MLRWRILVGSGLIAVLAALMVLDGHWGPPGAWLLLIALAVGLAGAQELIAMLSTAGRRPHSGIVYGGTLLVIASNAVGIVWLNVAESHALERLAWPFLAFAATLLAAFVAEMRRFEKPGGVIANLALTVFAVSYVGITLSFAAQLRLLGGPDDGIVALAALVIVVKMGDTGAYTVGRLIGRNKMAPVLSPGKTWEGAAGAVVASCLGAWLAFHLLPRAMDHVLNQASWSWFVFGLAVGITGLLGDLAESLIKRDAGCKDSSTWLPGFGGVLDLLDSILLAAPVAYFCWWLGTN